MTGAATAGTDDILFGTSLADTTTISPLESVGARVKERCSCPAVRSISAALIRRSKAAAGFDQDYNGRNDDGHDHVRRRHDHAGAPTLTAWHDCLESTPLRAMIIST
jgi:hypothetical protein